jgi:hypothetical protein
MEINYADSEQIVKEAHESLGSTDVLKHYNGQNISDIIDNKYSVIFSDKKIVMADKDLGPVSSVKVYLDPEQFNDDEITPSLAR